MKKAIIISSLLIASCNVNTGKKELHRCVVTSVEAKDKYSFISDGKYYTIKTDCGYTLSDARKVEVGDTITVEVIDMRKNSTKK